MTRILYACMYKFESILRNEEKNGGSNSKRNEKQIGGLKQFSDYNKSDWNCKCTKDIVVVVNVYGYGEGGEVKKKWVSMARSCK